MNQAKKHCYLYTRVSTQMQVDGYSLDAQQDRLKREAAHRSMQVVATFSGPRENPARILPAGRSFRK